MLTANEKRCEERILKTLSESEATLKELIHKTNFSHQTVTRLLVYMGLEPDIKGFYSYPDHYEPTGILPPVEQVKIIQEQPKQETFFSKINKALEAQLEVLCDKALGEEQLEQEIKRTRAITDISKQMTDTGRLVLEATKFNTEYGGNRVDNNLLSMG